MVGFAADARDKSHLMLCISLMEIMAIKLRTEIE